MRTEKTRAFQAYGTAGKVTAKNPRSAALAYFEKFPNSRKCSVVEGIDDGLFFTVVFGRKSDGEWPESFKDVSKKGADILPGD
jgi:hypothetical protein